MLHLTLLLASLATSPPAQDLTLWYDEPAARWEEALPVGNGRLGAMVFGGVGAERLALNEDTIWAGAPFERDRKGAHEHLAAARELFFEGRVVEGQALMQKEFMTERIIRSYQPLGDLTLTFPGHDAESVEGYRRDLDLDDAVATTRYTHDDVLYMRKVFASPANDVLVVHVTSNEAGKLDFDLTLERERDADVEYGPGAAATLRGQARQSEAEDAPGVRFTAALRVRTRGGVVTAEDDRLTIRGAHEATVLLGAGTDYRGDAPDERAVADVAGADRRRADQLFTDHIREHRRLMQRVSLDLGGWEARERPTDERLAAVRDGATDPALLALYFQYGRYLLASCSRPGSMPANLQGLWNPHIQAPWNSDYHININCQMNYWPAEVANLAECHEPFFDLVDGIRARGAATAAELYDAPGWVAHHTTDAWFFTSPIGRTVWGLWPTGGAWCTRHLFDHYAFGGDLDFLRTRAWPALRGAAEFFLHYLARDPETGRLVSGPASSPENSFRTSDGQVADTSMGPSMDQQIVWDLFGNVLAAAEALEVEDELVERVRAARAELALPVIGDDGRLTEWARPYEETEPGHRHVSHLYGLHPGSQYTLATPNYLGAARKSLEHRLANGGGHTGWSRAWIINFYARLHDGDAAHEHLLALLRKSTLPNLFDDHPPFQIDGNFGGTAGVAEMLLQSHDGHVTLLPALPGAWAEGSVRGLRARGGLTVDLAWKDGALENAQLRAEAGGTFRLRLNGLVRSLELSAGETRTVDAEDFSG
ncbi:MAG: glycoside hydrolase family 95 protein [Planctomycetota bacterium]